MTHDMTIKYYGHKSPSGVQEVPRVQGISETVARAKEGSRHTLGRLMEQPRSRQGAGKEQLRSSLEYGWSMAGVCLEHLFFRQERTFVPSRTNSFSVGNGLRFLRYAVCVILMMVVGVNEVKGQTDYSGIFLIANNNDKTPNYNFNTPTTNYYMCPAEGYVFYVYESDQDKYTTTDTGMPFVTTYQCYNHSEDYDLSNALWEIQKIENTNYYYIIHKESEKYLTYNGIIVGTTKDGRMRFHLETNASPGNTAQFTISKSNDGYFNISPRNNSSNYLNPAKGNYDNLTAEPGNNNSYLGKEGAPSGISIYGIVGIFNKATDAGSKWYLETLKPVINYDSSNNKIVLSHVDENATIYYTTDGNDPSTEQTDNKGVHSIEITNVNSSVTIKAIAERSGIVSHVSEIRIVPNATISFGSSPIVYNGSAQEPTVTVKDGNDVISSSEYSVNYSNNNTNAGETVTVTITDNAGGDYIVCGSATFTISPKPLTITANDKTITYGDAPTNDGVTYSEFAGTETSSVLTGTLSYAYNYSQYGDAGSYTITPSGLSNSNYDITFVPGTLTVNKKEVTVTSGITASDKIYDGTTDATLDGTGAVIEGIIGSDDLTVTAVTGTFDNKNVGTDKEVTISDLTLGGSVADNYELAPSGQQTYTTADITAKDITVSGIAASNKTYDGTTTAVFDYTAVTLTGKVIGDDLSVTATGTYDTKDVGTGKTVTISSLTLSGDDKDNYVLVGSGQQESTTANITPATLTVTADNKTVEYGSPAPEYTVTITGFVNNETLSVLTTIPTATCEYTTTSPKGSYDIVPSGGVDENYDFTYLNGTLIVAAAFVTLTANSETVTYSGTEQTITGFTYNVDGQTLTFPGVSASGSGTAVGTYPVTFTGVTENTTTDSSGDYVVTSIVEGTLTINPAEATVTADDKSKTYGEADPALTATVAGLFGSDAITYSLSRATGNNAGTYTITPTGETTQGNYTVSYVPGTFTISQKDLTITAADCSITYGEAPSNAVTYSGFITGESENTEGVFTGTLVYSYNSQEDGQGTSYTTTIPAGTSYIIPSGLTATNYAITYVAGTLTVNAKSIGSGSLADGFTLDFGPGGVIILKDSETTLPLYEDTDYKLVETTSTSGRYSQRTVTGKGNYTGSISFRNANVNFQTDTDQMEWSATFVAEPAGAGAADNTKGHKLPDGVAAYIITDIIGEWAIPEPLDYIPEGVPVILVSDNASGGFLVEDVSGKTPPVSTNWLKEVTESTPTWVDDTKTSEPYYNATYKDKAAYFSLRSIYLLSMNEFVQNMPGYLAKGKVYLDPTTPTPSPSPAPPRLRIKWDDVTGIKELQNDGNTETQDAAWYSLDGRKLNGKPTQKGMYINGGKKVIITSQQGNR